MSEKYRDMEQCCFEDIAPEWAENTRFVFNPDKFAELVVEDIAQILADAGRPLTLSQVAIISENFEKKCEHKEITIEHLDNLIDRETCKKCGKIWVEIPL